jgi:GNAT superfamily N-acetyltransferase
VAVGYVRPARPEDAGEIARVQLATWRIAYRRMLPRGVLDQIDEEFLAQRWREAVTQPPSARHRVLVAVEQAEQSYLVGFTGSGPADQDVLAPDEQDSVPGPDQEGWRAGREQGLRVSGGWWAGREHVAAVTELLVEPRWGRRGHGSRLLAASVDLWREDGFSTAVAWVYERDAATRKLLTSAGWEADGATRAIDVDDLLVPQLRLHVSL